MQVHLLSSQIARKVTADQGLINIKYQYSLRHRSPDRRYILPYTAVFTGDGGASPDYMRENMWQHFQGSADFWRYIPKPPFNLGVSDIFPTYTQTRKQNKDSSTTNTATLDYSWFPSLVVDYHCPTLCEKNVLDINFVLSTGRGFYMSSVYCCTGTQNLENNAIPPLGRWRSVQYFSMYFCKILLKFIQTSLVIFILCQFRNFSIFTSDFWARDNVITEHFIHFFSVHYTRYVYLDINIKNIMKFSE